MKYFYCFFLFSQLLLAEYSSEYSAYLLIAVENNNYQVAELALANGADPNAFYSRYTFNILEKAYLLKNRDIINLLMSHGAKKKPLLKMAVKSGDIQTCEFLKKSGVKIDNNEMLFWPRGENKLAMIEWLLNEGLDINFSRSIAGDYKKERLLFTALFSLCLGYGPGQDTISFSPSYPMLLLLKNYQVDTGLPVLDDKTIFDLIEESTSISEEEKEELLKILKTKVMIKSARSTLSSISTDHQREEAN